MKIPGIKFSSQRDAGKVMQYTFAFGAGSEAETLLVVLRHLESRAEVSVPDPSNGDCSLEVRKTDSGFEVKRGCHGSFGTWRHVSEADAIAWLLPGAQFASRNAKPGFGGIIDVPVLNDA